MSLLHGALFPSKAHSLSVLVCLQFIHHMFSSFKPLTPRSGSLPQMLCLFRHLDLFIALLHAADESFSPILRFRDLCIKVSPFGTIL